MASEIYVGLAGADGLPIVAVKTVQINPTTGVAVTSVAGVSGATGDGQADVAAPIHEARLFGSNPAGTWDRARLNTLHDLLVQQRPATTWVSATGAGAAAVTLTIPAAGAGLFNYVTYWQIVAFATALLTAAATPVVVTTTGLAGTPAFSFPATATPQGAIAGEQKYEGQAPAVGSAANTAITIVCPATTGIIWRVNAAYFVA